MFLGNEKHRDYLKHPFIRSFLGSKHATYEARNRLKYHDDPKYMISKPCQFLEDKKCTIYSIRPEECRSYSYLLKDDFISRLFGAISNYELCPIVYNVYELLKRRFNFK